MAIITTLGAEEVLQSYLEGRRNFNNCALVGEFRGMDLSGASFINCDWAEHDLTGAILKNVTLTGSCLEQTLFNEANLSGANLTGAFLNQTEFIEADLTGAYLINAYDIQFTNFSEANLTDANLFNGFDQSLPMILDDAIFHNTTMPDGRIRNGSVES